MSTNPNPTPVNKNSILNKFIILWRDTRDYKIRIFVAASVSFALCFTFLFFGPIEIVAFSASSFSFTVMEILPLMAIFMLLSTIAMSLLLSLLKGRIFNYIITAVFSLTLCSYVQGNFLNRSLGALTGDAISWQDEKIAMLINLVLWFFIFLIPFVILYFNNKIWRKTVVFISMALVIMQMVAFATIIADMVMNTNDTDKYYLSSEEMFTYSKENNTLLFIMDRLDYDYLERVLNDSPSFFDELDGFTSYTNAISEYARTTPAANFMLTGAEKSAYNMPAPEYYASSWESEGVNILKDLNDANYKIDLYGDFNTMFGTSEKQKKYVANISDATSDILKKNIIEKLTCLSIYRYAPIALKPFYWSYTESINDNTRTSNKYQIDEGKYFTSDKKIDLVENINYFKFYHFFGSHEPYTLNRDGTTSETPTTVEEQTMGSFQILFNTFKEMKRLGIYKDASIIILGDHGSIISNTEPQKKATRIGLFYKPAGREGTDIKYSKAPVSLKNIPSTIIKSAGLDYKEYGKPLDEVGEDEKITRYYYKGIYPNGSRPESDLYVYEINGDAADFRNWKEVRVEPIKYPFY